MSLQLVHIEENEIKYLIHQKGSIFEGIKIRENPDAAFESAIKKGMKNSNEWMYMYSNNGKDYFKNYFTRKYKAYPQFTLREKIRISIKKSFQ